MTNIETATTAELQELLGSIDSSQIKDAAREFALRHDGSAASRMLEILRTTNDARVRNAVAMALSDLQIPQAFQVIVDLLQDARTLGNRGTLLYALGAYDCSPILPVLVECVINGNYEVSLQALANITGIKAEIDEETWESCTSQILAALPSASEERRPLLTELFALFSPEPSTATSDEAGP